MINTTQLSTEITYQPLKSKSADNTYSKQNKLIQRALKCLEERMSYQSVESLKNPFVVRSYLQLQLASELNEVFGVIFLDNQHRVIAFEKLFFGTIDSATVHPRVIIQRALFHNAAAVILAHNHPSGNVNPSVSDQYITKIIKTVLQQIDVKVLDHIIVSLEGTSSFVERNLLFP